MSEVAKRVKGIIVLSNIYDYKQRLFVTISSSVSKYIRLIFACIGNLVCGHQLLKVGSYFFKVFKIARWSCKRYNIIAI